jgi:signal transduction histidine kinase
MVALLAALLATGAPVAHHVVGAQQLRAAGASIAGQVAEVLAHEAQQRPVLWRYDSVKLLEHLRAYRAQADVARIEVVDGAGALVNPSSARAAPPRGPLLWASAPVVVRGQTLGTAWVAMSAAELRRRSLALFALFAAAGAALAFLVAWTSLRTAGKAEARIRALLEDLERSRAALAALARGLEADVQARTEELARANAALRAEEQRLRETAARALALQERERRVIGRDLHDSVGQALTAMRIHAQLVADRHAEPEEVARLAGRMVATTDATLEELRRALARLGPAVLDEVGLGVAVTRLADDLAERDGIAVACETRGLEEMPPTVEVACYRIVQEALTNVARHARASCVEVRVLGDPARRMVVAEVEDDGVGCDGARAATSSRGLAGMRERAELLGGRLTVTGAPGQGTRVRAEIPYELRAGGDGDAGVSG